MILRTMLSLRIRLAIAVALTVAVTVGGAGWLALRVSGETLTGAEKMTRLPHQRFSQHAWYRP